MNKYFIILLFLFINSNIIPQVETKKFLEGAIITAIEKEGEVLIQTDYDPQNQVVRLEVSDNGCGIPEEDKGRLFEPYYSTRKGGTGLGLAIVNTIISDHNGYIRVRDNRPKGTTFLIEFPVRV